MDWDPKYTGTAIFCLIVAFIATIQGYQGFVPPDGSQFDVFIEGFVYGMALTALVNELSKWPEDLKKVKLMAMKGMKIE